MKKIVSLVMMLFVLITSLNSFSVSAKAEFYWSTLKDGTVEIAAYSGDEKSITLPIELNGKKVTRIGEYAFAHHDSIESVTIPDTITKIADFAFFQCKNLKNIKLNNKIVEIDSGSFYLTAYYYNQDNWEDGCLYIGKYLVNTDYNNAPKKYTIKKGTRLIGNNAFSSRYNLEKLTIPSSVKYIGDYAFNNTSLKKVTIENGLKEIGEHAFDYCLFKTITIPPSVKKMGEDAIYGGVDTDKRKNYTIKGYFNTAAEKFSKSNKNKFVALNPKTPKFSVKAGKKSFKVTYKKVKNAVGFQVKYKQGKTWKTKLFETQKTVTKKIKAKKGTCKVKIRSYKVEYNKKIYSKWTKLKKITVK